MLTDGATTADALTEVEGLDEALRKQGATEAIDRLIASMEERRSYRGWLDALLLKARHELGLPLVASGSLAELPEPVRTQYEDRYVEAIRTVGRGMLDAGDIVGAWPYFRAIGEKEPVAKAIDDFRAEDGDERIGQIVEVAFNQGAHPRRGFELILDHYGTCSAITAFEHLPPDESIRSECASRLTRQLHEHLKANLRAEIQRRGQPLPVESAPIADHLQGSDWLFAEDAYHIDVSHLAAVVRMAPLLRDAETMRQALDLTEYGRRLSTRHRYEGEPPFEDTYEDHAAYLRGVLGDDVDGAVEHFRTKLAESQADDESGSGSLPAQVLVRLLEKAGRLEDAIELAAAHLGGAPESMLFCSSLPVLCQRAGRPDLLARYAIQSGDLVSYLAARLSEGKDASRPAGQ